jgi:defect-in-organelle-trafficking protein DotC
MIISKQPVLIPILVIYITVLLGGCAAKSTSPKECTVSNKISSAPINPYTPYEVASSGNAATTSIAEAKENLRTASGDNTSTQAIGALRAQALRETALSVGARGGLAERASQINATLLGYEPVLARVFKFSGLVLDDNILPPVLVEGRNTLNLAGGDAIRISDRTYKILAQARFITAAPTWREYLWMAYDIPDMPDKSLLPRNKPERIMWERDIDEGWEAGMRQAELIYTENINRIVRDFNGMILYRKLLAQNMVSPPFVAAMDMGITGGGNDMTVNDRVLRITTFPQLQAGADDWKTEIRSYE